MHEIGRKRNASEVLFLALSCLCDKSKFDNLGITQGQFLSSHAAGWLIVVNIFHSIMVLHFHFFSSLLKFLLRVVNWEEIGVLINIFQKLWFYFY